MLTKFELRKTLRAQRRSLVPADAQNQAKILLKHLLDWQFFKRANCIATYVSFADELETHTLINTILKLGKTLCVPRVNGNNLELCQIRVPAEELVPGAFNILEPSKNCPEIAPAFPQLHIVPALAFDANGNRLGYGRGFYDRLLEKIAPNAITLGIGYDFQLQKSVPAETHDKRLNFVATPTRGIIACD